MTEPFITAFAHEMTLHTAIGVVLVPNTVVPPTVKDASANWCSSGAAFKSGVFKKEFDGLGQLLPVQTAVTVVEMSEHPAGEFISGACFL